MKERKKEREKGIKKMNEEMVALRKGWVHLVRLFSKE